MKKPIEIVSKELKCFGFRKISSNTLCLRIDDIALIIGFEKPGLLYAYYTIIPLFMPCNGYPALTYGNRLCRMYSDCPALSDPGDNEIEMLGEAVIDHVKNDIIYFARALYSSWAISLYCESSYKLFGRWNMRYLFTPPDHRARLFMYSSLYSKEYEKAKAAANRYIKAVKNNKYILKKAIERDTKEAEEIIEMIEQKQYQYIEERLKQNVKENLAMLKLADDVDDKTKKRLLYLQVVDKCYGGSEVDSIIEEIVNEAMTNQDEIGQKTYLRNRLKTVFHVEGKRKPFWFEKADWPMGKNSPMQFISCRGKGDKYTYHFRDVDTGEKRTIIQYFSK